MLVLNALLGLGTALAPLLVAVFVGLDFWWGLPVLAGAALAGILAASLRLPLTIAPGREPGGTGAPTPIPPRFWVYAAFAVCYGICETMNGNWATLDMKDLGASTTQASLALQPSGRVSPSDACCSPPCSAGCRRVCPTARCRCCSSRCSSRPRSSLTTSPLAILTFGLAGLGCSALLPLSISLGQGELAVMGTAVAGGVVASYQVGYGIAAFGAGPLQSAGIDLPALFGWTALVAAAMAALAFVVTRARHPSPAGA